MPQFPPLHHNNNTNAQPPTMFSTSFDTWSRQSSKESPDPSQIGQEVGLEERKAQSFDESSSSREPNSMTTNEPAPRNTVSGLFTMNEHTAYNNDTTARDDDHSFPARGSIRNGEHSWDADQNFPIFEIQRIKRKTKKLRSGRNPYKANSNTNVFRDVILEDGFDRSSSRQQYRATAAAGGSVRSGGSAARIEWSTSRNSKDSLSEALGDDSENTGTTVDSDNSQGHKNPKKTSSKSMSANAAQAQSQLLRDFHKPRTTTVQSRSTVVDLDITNHADDTSTEFGDPESNNNNNLTLHDLCGEATSRDDVAWRNALFLLASQPTLARVVDPGTQWTPLHICCLSHAPLFMVRALLYTYPHAVRLVDDGGRLPLHLVAASSGDPALMQLLVEEHTASVHHRDDFGMAPLHLWLRNRAVELTLERAKILLGHTTTTTNNNKAGAQAQRRHVLQRRGDHLDMSVRGVDRWLSNSKRPTVTDLNHNAMAHEQQFGSYPQDVQVSLRKLAQWKHRQGLDEGKNKDDGDAAEAPLQPDDDNADVETNPAALLHGSQMPIHMLVQRALMEEADADRAVRQQSDAEVDSNGEEEMDTEVEELDDDEGEGDAEAVREEPRAVSQASSVLRVFAAACPEALLVRDAKGLTPLLQSMQMHDCLPTFDVVEILLGKRSAGYEALPTWASDLPIHNMSGNSQYINAAMLPVIETGQLPLHLAAEEMAADSTILQSIHACYPGAIHVQDNRGRTPLHLALRSYRGTPADPQALEILFSERAAQVNDDYGNLPFDLLVESAKCIPAKKPRTVKNNGELSTDVYQRLFHASILGSSRPDTPAKLSGFLRRLRHLPPWLRSEACAVSFVQDLLVKELSSPWKCAVIMLDGFVLIALITVFRVQMAEYVQQLESPSDSISQGYTYAVYATAIFRLFALLINGGLAFSLGEFRHLCLFNVWYITDVLAMVFSIVTSVLLFGSTADERLLVLGTITTFLLWICLVGYLSSWWYGMALFTGGFSKIAHRLVCPFIAGAALIIAFAQGFYTLLKLECGDAIGGSPTCTARDSYRVVYMLFRGDTLLDRTGGEKLSVAATVLVASFLLSCIVFLLSLVITVLLTAARLDIERIALSSYWEPKLAFVLSAGDFGIDDIDDLRRRNTFVAKQGRLWDKFMLALFGDDSVKNGIRWHASPVHSICTCFIAVFVVPIWIILGLITFGTLWPPQIRRWLFSSRATEKERTGAFRNEHTMVQMTNVQSDLMQIKLMSHEKSTAVEHELRELKNLLYMAMQQE